MYARGGRRKAEQTTTYEALYEQYRPRLVAYCSRLLGNQADAEDVAHETLLRVYRVLPEFDSSADAWPWLATVAGRICTDIRRRAARLPSVAPPQEPSHEVHEQVVGRLRADILDDALRRLPDRYRTPLVLREYAGWTYDDIARVQGKSVGSIRSLLTRGRRRLEAQVESVARTRGQWPLPGVVPPVRRFRDHVRSWREAVARSPSSVLGALELSSVATRWAIGAQVTLVGAMTFAAATAGSHPAAFATTEPALVAPSPAATWLAHGAEAPPPTTPAAPIRADAAPVPTPSGTVTHVGATTPLPPQYDQGVGVGGGTEVEDSEDVVYINHYDTVTVPGVKDRTREGRTNVPCHGSVARTVICSAVRTTAEHAPEQ